MPFSVRLATLVLALGLCACAPRAPSKPDPVQQTQNLKTTLDALSTSILRASPERATSLAVSEAMAGGPFSARLGDYSTEGLSVRVGIAQKALAALDAIDASSLARAEAVSLDVAQTALRDAIAGAKFGYGEYGFGPPEPYVVTQISGAYTWIPDFLDSQHRLETVKDAEDYLARLRDYARVLDEESSRITRDASSSVTPPDFVIEGALRQLRALADQRPEAALMVTSLARRGAQSPGIGPERTAALVGRAEAIMREFVLPAYRRQVAALASIRQGASHEAGVGRLPNGEAYYAAALRAWTTTDLSPDQVHAMGLRLVRSLNGEMEALLTREGVPPGPLAQRMAAISKRPDQLYPNTDAGKGRLLRDLNAQVDAVRAVLPGYFGVLPKAKLEIKRVPAYIEAGAPGGYYQSPALDGSRPGAYYINLRDTAEWPRFSLPTLTYHEGEPGHHFQIAVAQESGALPFLRSALLGFSGYQEGWGLYAEQLADEIGMYKPAPLDRLGYLQSMAFRAARLVVDTGLHHKGWSRERAIDYMVEATGDQRSAITTEVERYAVWPGQACSYMVGRETLNRLRREAREALGARFDIKAFHDVVLTNGATPLAVLDRIVKAWIADQRKAG